MRTPDANVLVYALDRDAAHHQRAREWLEGSLSGTDTVGFSWSALLAVLRLTTHPAVFEQPLPVGAALEVIGGWLEPPVSVVLHPTERHPSVLGSLLASSGAAGNLVADAHLAAIAIEHGATLATFDGDFHRFAGLKLEFLG